MPHYWSWEADEAYREGKKDGRYYHENSYDYDRYSDREKDKAYYDGIEEAKRERRREEERREEERQEEEMQQMMRQQEEERREEERQEEEMQQMMRQQKEEYYNAMQEQEQNCEEPGPPTEKEQETDGSQSST